MEIRELLAYLEFERLFGSDFVPSSDAVHEGKPSSPGPRLSNVPLAEAAGQVLPAESIRRGVREPESKPLTASAKPLPEGFSDFRAAALACTNCSLCKGRTQVVFGDGSLESPVVLVGEGPGEEEDRQGIPFVGKAGRLLTRVLEKLRVPRDRLYIANVVKCRPPGNRVPSPEEIRACMPLLLRQIRFIRPKVVCALGATASRALLNNPKIAILSWRGRYVDCAGMKVFLTLHPSYCLRNPGDTYMLEEDLGKLFRDVGLIN